MRRLDELIVLYRGQGACARRYLLSQMEDLGLAFDSDELLSFLKSEAVDPAVRGPALHALARFLPAFLRRRYALSEAALGVWSAYARPGQPPAPLVAGGPDADRRERAVRHAALHATRELASVLAGRLSAPPGWSRTRAALALAPFGSRTARGALAAALAAGPPDAAVGLALAGRELPDGEGPLLELIRREGPAHPDLYLVLAACRTTPAFELLMDAIPRAGTEGRMNLARALAAHRDADAPAAFDRLVAGGEGWVVAAALAAAEELGRADLLDRVARVHARASHATLRRLALKAAGGIPCDAALELVRGALRSGADAERAVAIESMARLRAEPAELAQAARPHVASRHVKLAVNALLASMDPASALRAPRLDELLFSPDVYARLEAAYCLGYLPLPAALEFLDVLASEDPSPAVRIQALKSMSRWPAAQALPLLTGALGAADARLARTAAQLLMRFDGEEARQVAEAMEAHLARSEGALDRGLALWVLGGAARKSHRTESLAVVLRALARPEREALAGALEAANMLQAGAHAEGRDALARLAEHPDPALATRALVARWHSGDLEAPALLARRIASADNADAAVDGALEIGSLLDAVAAGLHFPALSLALAGRATSPEVEEFLRAEGAPVPAPVARGPALRAVTDFDPCAAPADAPPATGAAPSRADLARFLAGRPARGVPVERRIAEESVLLDASFGASLVEYLVATVRAHPVATALALLVAVGGSLVAAGSRGEPFAPPPPGFPGAMWVAAVEGEARMGGQVPQVRAPVPAGVELTTGKAGSLALVTPEGNQLLLRASSAVVVEEAKPGRQARYRLRDARGEILFEFRRNAELELAFRSGRLTAGGACVVLSPDPGPRSLTVVAGRASWVAGGKTIAMEKGDSVSPD